MSSVHNATEHSYVKEQSKGCSFAISLGRSAPVERLSGCSLSFTRPYLQDTQSLHPAAVQHHVFRVFLYLRQIQDTNEIIVNHDPLRPVLSPALGLILILLTTSVGQPIVLYVSALNNVDQSLVEAAEVDGATKFQCFWKIKWPQIMPTTLYILVITTINSFQCFALIQLLTSGGPNHSTDTIMYYIYYNAFKLYRYGYGNAMGVVLAIIIAVLSAVQFKMAESK